MRSPRHIPALDGVRGLAFLLVFLCHYGGGSSSPHRLLRILGDTLRAGNSGVCLFFVLSGFLITGILWDSRGAPGYFRFFYIRRVLRIFPLYYATILLLFVASVLSSSPRQNLTVLTSFAFYYENLVPIRNLIDVPFHVSHLWSLAVEEQFYLLWPLLIFLVRNLRQARALCVAIFFSSWLFRLLAELSIIHIHNLDQNPIPRAVHLAAGAYLALALRNGDLPWRRILRVAPFSLSISLALLVLFYSIPVPLLSLPDSLWVWADGLYAIFYASLLVLALKPLSIAQSFFSISWLRHLGTISYGLYIFHLLFRDQYTRLAAALLPAHPGSAQSLLQIPIAAAFTLLAATLSYRFFESPFLRLKSHFAESQNPVPLTLSRNHTRDRESC